MGVRSFATGHMRRLALATLALAFSASHAVAENGRAQRPRFRCSRRGPAGAMAAIGTSRHSLRRNNSVAFGEKRTLTNRCLPASIYEHARRCAVVAAPA